LDCAVKLPRSAIRVIRSPPCRDVQKGDLAALCTLVGLRTWCSFLATPAPGTKRKCGIARVFPQLEVDRLCHQPAGHSRP
jgi:hypothetical protein